MVAADTWMIGNSPKSDVNPALEAGLNAVFVPHDLAAGEERSVYVPAGVAHGFCVTSELGALTYLLSTPFNAALELEINPFDDEINVAWTIDGEAVVSPKDAQAPTLRERREAKELPHFH